MNTRVPAFGLIAPLLLLALVVRISVGVSAHRTTLAPEILVLQGATLLDGTGAPPRENTTIVVEGDRITRVGATGTVAIPEGARVVDATGRWVIPGLWDLHVHLTKAKDEALPVLLANGITSVRDMGSDLEEIREMKRRIETGSLAGPRIWTPGPMLESPETMERLEDSATAEPWRRTRVPVPDPESAGRVVDSLAGLGVDFVKIREAASNEVYAAIAEAARERGLPLVGHAPYGMDPVEAAALGLASIEHASYPYPLDTLPARRREILEAFAESRVAIVPTLVSWRSYLMHPDSLAVLVHDTAGGRDPRRPLISDFLAREWAVDLRDVEPKSAESLAGWARFVERTAEDLAAMHEAGVPVLPGSDLATISVFPGFSLHAELEALVECVGLTPIEAIEAATRRAANLVGAGDSLGTVEVGKLADLLVLEADPTVDVSNASAIAAVVKDGWWYGREEIETMLGGVEPGAPGTIELMPAPERTSFSRCVRPRRPELRRRSGSRAAADPGTRAFVGVNVVPMDRDTVLEDRVVVIEGDRIVHLGPTGETTVPVGAKRMDATGAYLMPGLVEAHAHAAGEALPLYVASGVTTVRILSGSPARLAEVERLEADPSLPWPDLIVAGPLLAGEEVPWSHELVETPEAARRLVDAHHAAGYDVLKIYEGLSLPVYDAIVARAREVGVPFVGHVPIDVGIQRVIETGQATIEHADQLLYAAFGRDGVMSLAPERLDEIVELFRASDDPPCVTPTLHGMSAMMRRGTAFTDSLYAEVDWSLVDPSLLEWWNAYRAPAAPEAVERRAHFLQLQTRLAGLLHEANVTLLAGTDTPHPLLVPGRSLADEIGALRRAGLSPFEALAAATRNVGVCVPGADSRGVVAEGARADLLLVEENPLSNPETIRRPLGVMVRGRWRDRKELRELVEVTRGAYAAVSKDDANDEPRADESQTEDER